MILIQSDTSFEGGECLHFVFILKEVKAHVVLCVGVGALTSRGLLEVLCSFCLLATTEKDLAKDSICFSVFWVDNRHFPDHVFGLRYFTHFLVLFSNFNEGLNVIWLVSQSKFKLFDTLIQFPLLNIYDSDMNDGFNVLFVSLEDFLEASNSLFYHTDFLISKGNLVHAFNGHDIVFTGLKVVFESQLKVLVAL